MATQNKSHAFSSSSSSAASALSSSSSSSARSLDDEDDVPMQAFGASLFDVVHDPHAVKLCASLLSLLEQLKKLARGPDETVSRFAEEKAGADIYEVSLDRVRGSLSVRCLEEVVEDLDAATRDARQSLAHEIAMRKADIAGLEQEAATLTNEIRRSKGEGVDVLSKQLCNVNVMIGKHQDTVAELEARSEVQVKVKVKRVRTCVELLKTETSSEDQEVKMVPTCDAGIYVLGGRSKPFGPSLATVERYDVQQNRWKAVTSMNGKRAFIGSAVVDGLVYAIGGWDGNSLSSVECFSPKNGRWELVASLTTARDGCAVGALNGRVYVAGGFNGKINLSSVTSFGAGANDKQDVAPMTYRRYFTAGAVLGGFFYVVGGRDGSKYIRTVERYDPAKNEWELVALMHSKRCRCAVVACNGYLYALGGHDGSIHLSSVERFDPRLNRWEEVASMQYRRSDVPATVLDGQIYVMGGQDSFGGEPLSSVERYDPASNRWELVAPISAGRCYHAAVVAT